MGDKYFGCLLGLMLACCMGNAVAAETSSDFDRGSELVSKKSYKEALGCFDKAIQSNPKHTEAYLERALCNFHLGNYKEVLEDCKKVQAQSGLPALEKRQSIMMTAGAHNALGNYAEAVKACDEAIAISPNASVCYSDRAFAYKQMKRYDEALRDCGEAIKLDPKHASNYEMRASIYEELAGKDRAAYRQLMDTRQPGERPWEKLRDKMKERIKERLQNKS